MHNIFESFAVDLRVDFHHNFYLYNVPREELSMVGEDGLLHTKSPDWIKELIAKSHSEGSSAVEINGFRYHVFQLSSELYILVLDSEGANPLRDLIFSFFSMLTRDGSVANYEGVDRVDMWNFASVLNFPVYAVQADYGIVGYNPAFHEFFSDDCDLIGDKCYRVIFGHDHPCENCSANFSIENEDDYVYDKIGIVEKDLNYFDYRIACFMEQGETVVYGILRDVTEKKMFKEEIVQLKNDVKESEEKHDSVNELYENLVNYHDTSISNMKLQIGESETHVEELKEELSGVRESFEALKGELETLTDKHEQKEKTLKEELEERIRLKEEEIEALNAKSGTGEKVREVLSELEMIKDDAKRQEKAYKDLKSSIKETFINILYKVKDGSLDGSSVKAIIKAFPLEEHSIKLVKKKVVAKPKAIDDFAQVLDAIRGMGEKGDFSSMNFHILGRIVILPEAELIEDGPEEYAAEVIKKLVHKHNNGYITDRIKLKLLESVGLL